MAQKNADTQIIYVDEKLNLSFQTEKYLKYVNELKESDVFSGKLEEVFHIRITGNKNLKNIIFAGIGGEFDHFNLPKIRKTFALAIKKAMEIKTKSLVALMDDKLSIDATAAAIEAMHLTNYTFNKYLFEKEETSMEIQISTPYDNNPRINEAIMLAKHTHFARDLVNEPANVMIPKELGKQAKEYGEKHGFEVEVFDKDEIKKLKMTAFLAVAEGSDFDPKLIVMHHKGNPKSKEVIALVGKGLTFDSGGYSLKPSASMKTMKSDMAGSAAVIAAMGAIASSKMKVNVVGVVAACENRISDEAYLPGDIIGSMAGKTIEIDNTDAEGRLTLIDAVHYAITKQKATTIIDIATLTGAAIVALGEGIAPVLCNDDELWESILSAGAVSDEKVWRLPIDGDIAKKNHSKIADLKNSGGPGAGAISAGLFIKEFVQDKTWAHIDIAGPSFSDTGRYDSTVGATGFGTRLLFQAVKYYTVDKIR